VNSTQYELYVLIKELASDPNPQELTAKFIYTKWMERFPDKPLSAETIRKYLQVLEDRGLVVSEKSERGNKTLYYPMSSISDNVAELVDIEKYFDVNKLHGWFDSLNGGKEIYLVYDGAVIDARKMTDRQKEFILKNILNINVSSDINVSSEKEAVIEENKAGKDWERWEKVGNPTANDAVSSENLYNDADRTGTKSSNAYIENFGGEFMDESKEA
jgi:DNA-binding PadR family transcriptional regulator